MGCVCGIRPLKECFKLYEGHMKDLAAEGAFTPKHHLFWHALSDMDALGDPQKYSTWLDGSLNKTLKATCRKTSQATFEASVLLRMLYLMSERPTKRAFE